MPSSVCLRVFSQLSRDRTALAAAAPRGLLPALPASCFSTSAPRCANPAPKKKNMTAAPKRGARTLNVKKGGKGVAQDTSKRAAPGERKAMRKRIVLSNNNALEVRSLQDLDKPSALSERHEGQVRGIPEDVVDSLRAVEAFKPAQGWSLFRRPATLMRKQTMQLAQLLKDAETTDGEQRKTIRRVLVGERMSGKTTLLLQALAMAFLRDWVVINLPEAQDIVNAHTEYALLPDSHPVQYTQNTYTGNLLSQILKANERILDTMSVTTNPTLPLPLLPNATLKQLVQLGVSDTEASWPVFVALWQELTQPGRPPIMLAMDGLAHIMQDSEYLSAEAAPVHAHDLTLVRHFVDHLAGRKSLPNGGMVLAATSKSNAPASPALDFSVQVAEARQSRLENIPSWNRYKRVDERAMDVLKDVDVIKVGGLSKEEARAIIEYYAESGMLRAKVDEGFVTEKWSLAGMGNVGELERVTVRLRI
ncbi:mitochondrial ribosomal death-associated protein 3-domain-containing protein [Massariosphaeria phaeospora]|uniref:Small ribosomal subunit protein mS29 n=1 Tax=Massariosphaeria phaeospora TaxID=100035 RepID=A0A7C8MTF3_9PLEO|nr:mitochondrial ribosomal death-associated protein 3-domain-containing protein [Massariosphaeria phaeospora]